MFKKKFINKLVTYSDNLIINQSNNSYYYSDFINEISKWLVIINKEKINRNAIVSIIGDYSFSTIALFLALYENNNIIVPITSKVEDECNERISVSKADFVFKIDNNESYSIIKLNSDLDKYLIISEMVKSDKSGLILFSSGSTGKPKAMIHDLDILINSFLNKKAKKINFLVFLMFDHIGGLNTLLNCLSMGATITIPNSRNPEEVCKLIEEFGVNVLPASPTFLNLLLVSNSNKKYNLTSLIMITYGTESMPESLLARIKSNFPKVKLLQTFGTSETGIIKTISKSNSSTSIKIDDAEQEYKIVDGELWIRSKTQILGYLNYESNNFTNDGWFKTGDLVKEEEDRYFRIIGRLKEIINVGGEKVLPQEVESTLLELNYVEDVIVYSIPNAIIGEVVGANVVINKNVVPPDSIKNDIRNHCKSKLDSFKVPVKINIVLNIGITDRFKKVRK
jgi:acyl-coenzyme A synthetase/AMP-(fatty) acid ligase